MYKTLSSHLKGLFWNEYSKLKEFNESKREFNSSDVVLEYSVLITGNYESKITYHQTYRGR